MKKKILAIFLCSLMILSISNGVTVKAESIGKNIDIANIDNDNSLQFVDISKEALEVDNVPEQNANILNRQNAEETYKISQKMNKQSLNSTDSVASEVTLSNTDPNNAYVVTNDTVMQGAITTAGEMRWYAYSLNEKSKVTILLQMVDTLDADLYLYSFNEQTSQLDLIGGSATSGLGTTEYFNNVLNPGVYFFAVGGYEGSGNFAFGYYQSTLDVANEINDTAALATNIPFNTSVSGVIDNPNDIDYYKITVTNPTIIQYSISSSNSYSLLYGGNSGAGAAIYTVDSTKKSYKIMPGTYYFAVLSENGKYSSTSPYSILFKKVGSMTNDSTVTRVGISEEAGIIYQTNANGSVNYINGNPIDINYSYYQTLSNSAGSQFYDIAINPSVNPIAIQGDMFAPAAVHYHSSTRPAMHVGSQPALRLTFYSDSNFYKIHCRGTGAYSMNTLWEDLNNVTVIIDPATGKLIDILEFNYYYDFAPVGTNNITVTTSYRMNFYNN